MGKRQNFGKGGMQSLGAIAAALKGNIPLGVPFEELNDAQKALLETINKEQLVVSNCNKQIKALNIEMNNLSKSGLSLFNLFGLGPQIIDTFKTSLTQLWTVIKGITNLQFHTMIQDSLAKISSAFNALSNLLKGGGLLAGMKSLGALLGKGALALGAFLAKLAIIILAILNVLHWGEKLINWIRGVSSEVPTLVESMFQSIIESITGEKERSEELDKALNFRKSIKKNLEEAQKVLDDYKLDYQNIKDQLRTYNKNLLTVEAKRAQIRAEIERKRNSMYSGSSVEALQENNKIYAEIEQMSKDLVNANKSIVAAKEKIKELKSAYAKISDTVLNDTINYIDSIVDIKNKLSKYNLRLIGGQFETTEDIDVWRNYREQVSNLLQSMGGQRFEEIFARNINDALKSKELTGDYGRFKESLVRLLSIRSTDENVLKQQLTKLKALSQGSERWFDAYLNTLKSQRDKLVENFKSGQEALKRAVGLIDTSRAAVEADSMEAYKLQNRRLIEIQGLDPLLQEQRAIKQIDSEIRSSSEQAKLYLKTISDAASKVQNQLTRQTTGQSIIINPVTAL